MKRRCKNVQPDSFDVVSRALNCCFSPTKKRKRNDLAEWFAEALECSKDEAKRVLMSFETDRFYTALNKIIAEVQECIRTGDLRLTPIRQTIREDKSSHKMRLISALGIRQLAFDHVAVEALRDLTKRIGTYQVSSIPHRGTGFGAKAIKRWLKDPDCKYAVKMDVKDFYGSIDKEVLMGWLRHHVKNEPLLNLIKQLINTSPKGICIGSYLSQTLANIYLSDLYHLATEGCTYTRNSRGVVKTYNAVKHALFYMDDMLLIGSNKRKLKEAAQKVIAFAENELHLHIKPNWQVHRISHERPIDMMGFRFSPGRTTIRKRVFRSIRRSVIRALRRRRRHESITLHLARRLASYFGHVTHSCSKKLLKCKKFGTIFSEAFYFISRHEQDRTLHRETSPCSARILWGV